MHCVFVDEAQFLEEEQVWQLARIADRLNIPVMCYGLRTDFQGKLFSGSRALLAIADDLREVRTICRCGRKATMVVRLGPDGKVARQGEQVAIGKDVYVSLCRRHWEEEMGRAAPDDFIGFTRGLTSAIPAFIRAQLRSPGAIMKILQFTVDCPFPPVSGRRDQERRQSRGRSRRWAKF